MFVTRNVFLKFKCHKPIDGEGNDLPGGGEGSGTGEGGEGAAQEKKEGEGDEDGAKPEVKKPSDEEARLLKENMKRKADNKALQTELDSLKSQVAGLDLAEVKQMLAERKSAEEKQLEAKGDYDRLKQRMADEHKATVDGLNVTIGSLTEQLAKRDAAINELTVGNSFGNSQYIKELVLTPAKARALYGSHFELEDGKIVGYDKPRGAAGRTALVDAYGATVGFDAAMAKIIEADPDKDSLIRSKAKQGAGSGTKPATAAPDLVKGTTSVNRISSGLKGLNLM